MSEIILRVGAKGRRQSCDDLNFFYDPPCLVRIEYPVGGQHFFGAVLCVVLGRYRSRYQKCSWHPFIVYV